MKVLSLFKVLLILLAGLSIKGCSASISSPLGNQENTADYISRYMVSNQLPAPETINSIQLYRKGDTNNPPIIELGSAQKLILAFDELTDISGQFRITFTHYDQNWDESNIPQDWFLEGLNEIILGEGTKNQSSPPSYFHYRTEFPNNQLRFATSGNFMLHVSDFSSGVRLFSLPFFVTENAGEMTSWIETDYNAGPRFEARDRPFSNFTYPEFIDFPQFDLSFYFVQNRFWGDARKTENYDFSEKGHTQFYLSGENAFPANFDFIGLNLETFSVDGHQIIDWIPGENPPEIILREDILNFTSNPLTAWGSTFGNPKTSAEARYANIRFRFQDGGAFTSKQGVYLVGDFNQWIISEKNKLEYNQNSGYWETSALIKQGTYTYKYAIKDGTDIDDLILSDYITRRNQEYVSFVYFNDPEYRYQRLIHIQVFRSD
ncbi:MAG: DUF5103 domain-containing protein [Gracilimonas sp.]|uniref:type IX secretion system plug protein n=1 Tax=Gracilimonas sp. TaxID=1974203 RepID=UPI0019A899BB|nr:type IX secretion system plug protein domain-containing protein [Gracilimonas sp.]MBD3616031.1 DUF5103 domain-containing protein [Gracilimonas sp.]